MPAKKIAFYTLGCRVNQADTASMEELFCQAGYAVVPFSAEADVYVLNTCVVTNMGQSKSRRAVKRAAREHPKALIVVTGCYPQTAAEEVKELQGVAVIIGNQDKGHLVEIVEKALMQRRQKAVSYVRPWQGASFEELTGGNDGAKTRAYLKIQEGCNQYCTYCLIPYARGPLRSRSLESIAAETERLASLGYTEITLIGIHLGCYGRENPLGPCLSDAVRTVLKNPLIKRLRLGSLESVEVEDALLELMAEDKRFCPHLHLPLQAGSNKILRAMGRPYDAEHYATLVEKIRSFVPSVALTTDVIVGFPGETEEDYLATETFARRIGFAKLHIFPYSKRQGTKAATMPEQVPEKVKEERAERLAKVDRELATSARERMIGQQEEILLEQRETNGLWSGLTPNYQRVYVEAQEGSSGKIICVKLKEIYQDGLKGSII